MSNVKTVGIKVSGLSPLDTYNYRFTNKGGNWPVKVYPISGTFQPNSLNNVYEIKSYVEFCATTGLCPSGAANVLYNAPYIDSNAGASVDRTTLYSVLGLSVISNNNATVLDTQTLIECSNCLPNITLTAEENIELNDSTLNTKQIVTSVNGLVPNQTYTYVFTAIDSNWPVKVTPVSGQIRSSSDSANIKSLITLCANENDCLNDLAFTGTQNCDAGQNPFAAIKLTVSPANGNLQSPVSTDFTVTCDHCIPKLSLELPTSIQLDKITKNKTAMNLVASNLKVGKQYIYRINSVDANWPAIVTPISGRLTAQYDRMNIPLKVTFCPSTGLCPSDSSDVIDYSVDNACLLNYSNVERFVRFNAEITAESCDGSLDKVYSNDLAISCLDCLPSVKASIPTTMLLSEDSLNINTFSAALIDMIPGQKYEYSFKTNDSNWPTLVYPITGIISSDSSVASIPARITFCRSTGLCDGSDNLLDYTYDNSNIYSEGLERYSSIILEVKPINCSSISSTTSNAMLARCDNCLPTPLLVNSTNSFMLSSPGVNRYQLTTSAQSLIPGETYTYNVNYVDSNWPTIVSKQSGEFVAVGSSKNIMTELQFCFPSGSCAINTTDVMPYRVSPITSNTNKYTTINLSITDTTSATGPTISDDFTLTCGNCLPNINYSVLFSGGPTMILPTNCCSGNQVVRVNIAGAIAGDIHNYELLSSTPNMSFMPSSGQVIFKQGGVGTIVSMMSTALNTEESAIAQCKLTNISSNIEAVDFLVVKCGASAC
jgi:hypothetical protein